ncbi:MAG TPA: hypothetical protein PKL13_04525 [bacterium]|nr:hypothetical protein [bacterium]
MKKTYTLPISLLILGILCIIIFFNIGGQKFFYLIWTGLVLICIGISIGAILFVWRVSYDTKGDYSKKFDRNLKKLFPKKFYEKLGQKLFPRYNEIIFFALAISVLVLFFIDTDFSQKMIKILSEDLRFSLALLLGLSASLYHFFTKKKKSQNTKKFMSFFIFFFSCFVCFYSIKFNKDLFLFITSIINSIYLFFVILSYFVLIAYKSTIMDQLIDDYEPSFIEKIFSLVVIILIFYLIYFVFKMGWIATLSLLVFYTNLLNRGFAKLLFRFKK